MEEENKFILNLTRLCGPVNAVTFKNMLDTLTFINNNSITEGQFIEAAYLGSIFHEDGIFHRNWLNICSLQNLKDRYEDDDDDDDDFFTVLHQKHKNARKFLEDNGIKQQIRNLIETRKEKNKNNMIWNTVNTILELVRYYPDSNIAKIISPILPEIMESIPRHNGE